MMCVTVCMTVFLESPAFKMQFSVNAVASDVKNSMASVVFNLLENCYVHCKTDLIQDSKS